MVGVLMDPMDDVRVTVGLLACHDPSRGRVVVHPTPAPWGDHVFAHDLLAALGRPVNRFDDEHLSKAKAVWCGAGRRDDDTGHVDINPIGRPGPLLTSWMLWRSARTADLQASTGPPA